MKPPQGVLLLAVLFAAAAIRLQAADELRVEFPVDGALRGSRALFGGEPAVLLVGEIHGTVEIPLLAAVLLRTASADRAAVLCVEMPADEQARLDAFLASDGGEPAKQRLLAGPHWSSQDGRAGAGHFALLELARRLIAQGREITVVAIDLPSDRISKLLREQPTPDQVLAFARQRDRAMANRVAAAAKSLPQANVVVLAGNVHTRLQAGAPWDEQYKPMGTLLGGELPRVVSLVAETSGGQAWVSTDQGLGPAKIGGVDRGGEPFVELKPSSGPGVDGCLYVGAVTAAAPMAERVVPPEPEPR